MYNCYINPKYESKFDRNVAEWLQLYCVKEKKKRYGFLDVLPENNFHAVVQKDVASIDIKELPYHVQKSIDFLLDVLQTNVHNLA